jgi:predicted transcriptional regulator
VMSTMTTLAEKGLLKQDKSSKTYIYSAAVNNRELSKSIIRSVADKLLEESSRKIISSFFEDTPDVSAKSIEKLLKEIK